MAGKAQPWDQQPGEPDAAYKRFLTYLYLGRSRTLIDAYRLHAAEATEGDERHVQPSSLPGSWARESKAWDWVQRADRYDICEMHRAGRRVMQRLMDALEQHVDILATNAIRPESYGDYLKGLDAIGKHFTPETMLALLRSGDGGTEPARGGADSGPGGPQRPPGQG